jgi:hypothetical protein
VLALSVVPDRHIGGNPRERDVWLRAAQFPQRLFCQVHLPGHGGGGGEHAVRADEVATLAESFARELDGVIIIVSDELSVRRDATIDRREWIARA